MHRDPVRALLAIAALVAAALVSPAARADHIGDLCEVVGARENQLLGYGIVTGLNGTGDDASAPFATQSLLALMRRLGVQIDPVQLRLKNVAAVLVTATIPPFSRQGTHLDVTVSSVGNAKSLQGGVLVQTLLMGADLHVYAVAQGPLVLGGFSASGGGASVKSNSTTTARVPNGALIEKEIPTTYAKDDVIMLALRRANFATAARIVEAVDKEFGPGAATATDSGAVRVKLPASMKGQPVQAMAKLEQIDVIPVNAARVVINERTGTIVAGGDVRLMPVAIAQGGITIVIKETPQVSQPNPFSKGTTTVTPQTEIQHFEGNDKAPTLTYIDAAASLADVAHALSTLGVTPRDLASILQALKSAGALNAEIVMQ
jgi:flagellar P-ring protein precursor FlgI